MSHPIQTPRYTLGEEIANSVIHGLGLLLAIVGLAVLAALASSYGTNWHVVGCSIFGATLVLLYASSTLYHSIPHPRPKAVLRLLDHAAIYLLIAGTFTPFGLVNLRGPWGWSLLGALWGLAFVGILLRLTVHRKASGAAVGLYVAMGWSILVAAKPMLASVAPGGLLLLALGGLFYTSGVAFYVWRRLPYHHAIWHVFVLAGSAAHFFAVLYYVIPAPPVR